MTLAQPGKFREEAQGAAVARGHSAGGKRSWLAILRQASGGGVQNKSLSSPLAAEPSVAHKPLADMADLFLMGTLDQKAPPVLGGGAGGGDLLDTLVQGDLQRAQADLAAENVKPAEEPPPFTPLAEEPVSVEQTAMLQKEIDLLLHDDTTVAPEGSGESAGAAETSVRAAELMKPLENSRKAEEKVQAAVPLDSALSEAPQQTRPSRRTSRRRKSMPCFQRIQRAGRCSGGIDPDGKNIAL